MGVAGRQHDRHRLATAFGSEVDPGREAALAPAKRLGCRVPPFAPAACWCARTTVLSTTWTSPSICLAVSAWRWSRAGVWDFRTVTENCRTLKFSVHEFEEE